MIRIVIDTNVIVSGILNPAGAPGRMLATIFTGRCLLLYDTRIMQEYRAVLHRPKFGFNTKEIDIVLDFLADQGECIIAEPGKIILPDHSDLPFLEVAHTGRADALVTGNRKHFPAKLCKPIKIYSAPEFIQQVY